MIDLGRNALERLCDQWDALEDKVQEGRATISERALHNVSVRVGDGEIARPEVRAPFGLLVSTADLTQGNPEQIARIAARHVDGAPKDLEPSMLEPRLSCAVRYAVGYLLPEERTTIRESFDPDVWASLGDGDRRGVAMLVAEMAGAWSVEGLTRLVYGIPKMLPGIDLDAPPDAEMKKAQRQFFSTIYRLVCARDTGPRIPTLFLSLGKERVRRLLLPPDEPIET